MPPISFHKLSWQDIEKDCLSILPKLRNIKIDRIVSISRGGTVVSRIFSDLLGIIPISHITISSYIDLKKQDKPIIVEEPTYNFKDKSILIIDEVSDTGETFHIARDYFDKKKTKTTLTLAPYIKPHTTFKPDFWAKNIDAWIIFPYDIQETAEGFEKMFGKEHVKQKLLEVGFEDWEIEHVLSPSSS